MMRMMKFMFQSVETECSAELSASEGLGSGSGACSSLELDSSEPASPRRTDTTDPSDSDYHATRLQLSLDTYTSTLVMATNFSFKRTFNILNTSFLSLACSYLFSIFEKLFPF